MSPAELDRIDRASERAHDMAQFLAAHPEYRVRSVALPPKPPAFYMPSENTDISKTFARVLREATPERTP